MSSFQAKVADLLASDKSVPDLIDDLIDAIVEAHKAEVAKAQTNGVAWTIKQIDDMHFHTPGDESFNSDKLFKGIKNSIRDRYKLKTGIDPAPSYPITAHLTKEKTK